MLIEGEYLDVDKLVEQVEDGFLDFLGEVVASCEEGEREGEDYGDLGVG